MRQTTFTPLLLLLLAAASPAREAPAERSVRQKSLGTVAVRTPLSGLNVPPPGSEPRNLSPRNPRLTVESADQLDGPEIEREIEAESAELEELRQAEENAKLLDPARPEDKALRSSTRLGLESPLRLRIRDAFDREIMAGADAKMGEGGRIALLPELNYNLDQLKARYDIPIDVNEEVRAYVDFFTSGPARRFFVRWLERSHKYVDRYRQIMRENGLPEDTVYLAMIESGFANLAYSRARASGPWQFIAATGKRWGLKQDFWVDERRDPEKAAKAAAGFLRELHQQTGDWRLAWAGYNAGPGKILKAQQQGVNDFWTMAKGKTLRRETQGYVPKLMACAIVAKHPDAFGFRPEEMERQEWADYELVTIRGASQLAAIAKAAQTTEKELLDLNPELRHSCTPPRSYQLKLPRGKADVFAENWPKLEKGAALSFAHHRFRKGDTLGALSAAYGVPVPEILKLNGLRSAKRVRSGTDITIPLTGRAKRDAPSSEVAARTRIKEIQQRNPELAARPDPPRSTVERISKEPSGRLKATVMVQEGDSLWAIAQRYGVEVAELCRWNGIDNPRRVKLQIGREIVVYPRSVGGSTSQATPDAG